MSWLIDGFKERIQILGVNLLVVLACSLVHEHHTKVCFISVLVHFHTYGRKLRERPFILFYLQDNSAKQARLKYSRVQKHLQQGDKNDRKQMKTYLGKGSVNGSNRRQGSQPEEQNPDIQEPSGHPDVATKPEPTSVQYGVCVVVGSSSKFSSCTNTLLGSPILLQKP